MPYVTNRYERVKLYAEVWQEAVTTVAKRYGISDVALRNICKKLAVPLPPLDYWARVAAGRKSPTPPLPKYSDPAKIVRERYVSDEPVEPDAERLVARREFRTRAENRIVVSEQSIYDLMRRDPSFPRPSQIGSEFSIRGSLPCSRSSRFITAARRALASVRGSNLPSLISRNASSPAR